MGQFRMRLGENFRSVRLALAGNRPLHYRHSNGFPYVALKGVPETRELYVRGQFYEQTEFDLIRAWLERGDSIVDGGANVGLVSAMAASLVAPEGKVWAIEASPSTRKKLESVIHELGLEQIVSIVPRAISDRAGEVEFGDDDASSVANAMRTVGTASASGPTSRVPAISMDELLALPGGSEPSLVKLDIEGAEPLAFRGWSSLTSAANPPLLLFEVYPRGLARMGFRPHDIFSALPRERYRLWHLNASWPNEWPEFPRGVPFALDDPFNYAWPTHSNVFAVPTEGRFSARSSRLSGRLPGI